MRPVTACNCFTDRCATGVAPSLSRSLKLASQLPGVFPWPQKLGRHDLVAGSRFVSGRGRGLALRLEENVGATAFRSRRFHTGYALNVL